MQPPLPGLNYQAVQRFDAEVAVPLEAAGLKLHAWHMFSHRIQYAEREVDEGFDCMLRAAAGRAQRCGQVIDDGINAHTNGRAGTRNRGRQSISRMVGVWVLVALGGYGQVGRSRRAAPASPILYLPKSWSWRITRFGPIECFMDTRPAHLDLKKDRGLTIQWPDGTTSFYAIEYLRKMSPSAEARMLRQEMAKNPLTVLPASMAGRQEPLSAVDAELVGNYAIRIRFSDGHHTGIYSWNYLREIDPAAQQPEPGRPHT